MLLLCLKGQTVIWVCKVKIEIVTNSNKKMIDKEDGSFLEGKRTCFKHV